VDYDSDLELIQLIKTFGWHCWVRRQSFWWWYRWTRQEGTDLYW